MNAELKKGIDIAPAPGNRSDPYNYRVPATPCVPNVPKHRGRLDCDLLFLNACVARPVTKDEIRKSPAAKKALDIEWDKLVLKQVWDESQAFEWPAIAAEARRNNETVHVGKVFEICTEKGSELPDGDPNKKFKGRSVFQGNQVRDQDWNAAMFQDLGSAPAAMASIKVCDAYGLIEGHTVMQADAEAAYINARLTGPKTYVRLPKDRIPEKWKHLHDPVFLLVFALYGHPDSGGHWEQFCENALIKTLGWTKIAKNHGEACSGMRPVKHS